MVALSGTCSSAVAELAVFRTQLPHEMGGLDSGVLFIDGGNRSDPYLFSAFAKQWRLRPRVTMRRVATCRVFTMYQLTALISGYLDHAVDDYAAKLVVISDLLATFNEPELDDREARRLLDAIEEGVRRLQKKAMVMITLASPNEYDDTAAAWADTVVSLTPRGRRIYAELLRHPEKPRSASTFRLNEFLANNREG